MEKGYYKLNEIKQRIGYSCIGNRQDCKFRRKECVISSILYIMELQKFLTNLKERNKYYYNLYTNFYNNNMDFSEKCWNEHISQGNRKTQENGNIKSLQVFFDEHYNNILKVYREIAIEYNGVVKKPDFIITNDDNFTDFKCDLNFKYFIVEFKGSGSVRDIGDSLIQSIILKNKIDQMIQSKSDTKKIYKYIVIVYSGTRDDHVLNSLKQLILSNDINPFIHRIYAIHPALGVDYVIDEINDLLETIDSFFKIIDNNIIKKEI